MNIENNLMVFGSSPDFADNPRGFWEYININTSYDTCQVIKDKVMFELLNRKEIKCVLEGSREAREIIDKAHYLITSSFDFAYNKRIGQIHIAAWHGFPLKVIGFFDSAAASERIKGYNDTNRFNYSNFKIFAHYTQWNVFSRSP